MKGGTQECVTGKRSNVCCFSAESGLSVFSTEVKSIHLEPGQRATIEVHFLPFHEGKKQCSLLLSNDDVGQFVHTVEATVTLPPPQEVTSTTAQGRVVSAGEHNS